MPNGESRTGLSHSDIVTSVDLIPTFDSFVVLWFSGQSLQQAKTVGTVVRERNQKRAGMQTVESVLGITASVRTSE